MCLLVLNATTEQLDELNDKTFGYLNGKFWKEWCNAVLVASSSDLRYVELKREELWSAVFWSAHGSLEIHLRPQQPEWGFFGNPKDNELANAQLTDYRPPHRSLDLSRLTAFRPMGFCFIQVGSSVFHPLVLPEIGSILFSMSRSGSSLRQTRCQILTAIRHRERLQAIPSIVQSRRYMDSRTRRYLLEGLSLNYSPGFIA